MNKIHPTAIVHKDTKIHESVEIGPYSVIGPEVDLDKGNIIDCHVVIKGPSKFGQKNTFFPYSLVGEATPDLKYRGEKSLLNVGENNIFREFSKVHRGTAADIGFTQIGNNNLIMPGVMVAHDCILGDRNILVDNNYRAIIPVNNKTSKDSIEEILDGKERVKVVIGESKDILKSSYMAVVCSGTATLEAFVTETPCITIYKTEILNYFILSRLVKTEFISLPNIICNNRDQLHQSL